MYLIRPTRPEMLIEATEAEDAAMRDHFAYLQRLRDEGLVFLAGPSAIGTDAIGIVVLETEDEATARTAMENDPSVIAGVMQPELRPFRMSVR